MTASILYLRPLEYEDLSKLRQKIALRKDLLPSCSKQSKKAFPTNRLREWRKPMNGNAIKRGKR